jgi:hypothetical protein
LSTVGEKTPVFVRFSTVTLGREFPDEARNPRGFAIKFYTKEGNYDIVGLNFVSLILATSTQQLIDHSQFFSAAILFKARTSSALNPGIQATFFSIKMLYSIYWLIPLRATMPD